MYRPLASAFKSWAQLVVVISSVCAPLLPLHPEHAVSDSGLVHLKHHMDMDVRVVESMAIATGSEDGNHDTSQSSTDSILLIREAFKRKKRKYIGLLPIRGTPPLPPLARIGNFRFFLRLFSRGGWS